MLQRLIAAVLGVLGLAAIALGIASATAWRADDTLTADARTAGGTTLLTTAPGVLELGDPPVTVRATAPAGTKVVLAVGRDTDVAAWVGTDAHTVVTGLSDWHTFATDEVASTAEPVPAEPAPVEPAPAETTPAEPAPTEDPAVQPAPDPDGSDLWVQQMTGDGSAELVWQPRDGRWTLLAAGVGADAGPVTVELSWPQTVTTPWLVPGVVGGAVLLLLAGLLALRARRSGRSDDEWHAEGTGATAAVGTPGAAGSAPSPHRESAASAAAAAGSAGPRTPRTDPDGPAASTGTTEAPGTAGTDETDRRDAR